MTVTDLQTMDKQQLIDALRAGADGADMRAAVEMLVGYNGGDLLDEPEIRARIATGTPTRIRWTALYNTIIDYGSTLGDSLGETAYNAVLLACALRGGGSIPNLSRTLGQFDRENSRVAFRAFALALGLETVLDDYEHRGREIDRLNGIVSQLREASQPTGPAATTVDGGELDADQLTEQVRAALLRVYPCSLTPVAISKNLADIGINVTDEATMVQVLTAMSDSDTVYRGEYNGYALTVPTRDKPTAAAPAKNGA